MNTPQPTNFNPRTESLKYFKTWSKNDSTLLKGLFADDIVLQDWDNKATGIKEVLEANDAIFAGVESIEAKALSVDAFGVKAYCDLEVLVKAEGTVSKILVLDIITFDENGKIKSIRAYKG